jgi:hypothetical protein
MFTATPPLLEHVADLIVRVSAPTVVSCSRRVIGINGGEVMGARLHGKILPGGAEFQVIRADHTTELDARYVIETHSGALPPQTARKDGVPGSRANRSIPARSICAERCV